MCVAQGRYFSLSNVDKKFNASLIRDQVACPHSHWGIRVVSYANATTMRLGFVVGLKERLTAEVCTATPAPSVPAPRQPNVACCCAQELIRYPEFIITNHRDWNGLGWTLPVVAAAVVFLDLMLWFTTRYRWVPSILDDYTSPRSWCLQISAWAFLITATEVALHLIVFQIGAKLDHSLFVGLIVIVGIANILWWLLVVAIWRAHLYPGAGCYYSPLWFIVELATALSLCFLLGSGLWVGPAALALDAFLRSIELVPEGVGDRKNNEAFVGVLQEI